jgi:hypothetical protein
MEKLLRMLRILFRNVFLSSLALLPASKWKSWLVLVLIIDDCPLFVYRNHRDSVILCRTVIGGFGEWGIDCFMKCNGILEMLLLFIWLGGLGLMVFSCFLINVVVNWGFSLCNEIVPLEIRVLAPRVWFCEMWLDVVFFRASDKCQKEKRKTINGDDLLWAMATLGFEDYIEPLKVYLARYREVISLFSCLWFILFTYRLVCNLIIWLFSFRLFHRLVLLDHCHVTVGGNKHFSNWSIVSFFLFLLSFFFSV